MIPMAAPLKMAGVSHELDGKPLIRLQGVTGKPGDLRPLPPGERLDVGPMEPPAGLAAGVIRQGLKGRQLTIAWTACL